MNLGGFFSLFLLRFNSYKLSALSKKLSETYVIWLSLRSNKMTLAGRYLPLLSSVVIWLLLKMIFSIFENSKIAEGNSVIWLPVKLIPLTLLQAWNELGIVFSWFLPKLSVLRCVSFVKKSSSIEVNLLFDTFKTCRECWDFSDWGKEVRFMLAKISYSKNWSPSITYKFSHVTDVPVRLIRFNVLASPIYLGILLNFVPEKSNPYSLKLLSRNVTGIISSNSGLFARCNSTNS